MKGKVQKLHSIHPICLGMAAQFAEYICTVGTSRDIFSSLTFTAAGYQALSIAHVYDE